MIESELVRLYPKLYHMAEDGSLPSILEHGLLSTRALLDLFGVPSPEQRRLTRERRPESVVISSPKLGSAVIRDQKPLRIAALESCLVDMTPEDWLETLNDRVFFWLQEKRLHTLLNAGPYRSLAQTVLVLDTASLLAAHRHEVRLSRINSGSTIYRPAARGSGTFQEIQDYPHPPRRLPSSAASDIAELCVLGGVLDVRDHLVEVQRWRGDEFLGRLM